MKRSFKYKQPPSARRPLKIYAFDPMLGRRSGGRITIDIPNEPNLQPGPRGERIAVIDYDGANKRFYSPVDLNDPAILMDDGLNRNLQHWDRGQDINHETTRNNTKPNPQNFGSLVRVGSCGFVVHLFLVCQSHVV